jgi:putative ABC transport system ATP-binding protein
VQRINLQYDARVMTHTSARVRDTVLSGSSSQTVLDVRGLRTAHVGPVDFHLLAGEICKLSGPSGAGKTLLLRALADLDPNDGEVLLDGRERARIAPTVWRRRVAYLPAEPLWWDERVGMHLDPGAGEDTLQMLGFGPDVRDWEVERLSSGERQRLALVRLLENRPRVLLLDEPTANLDPANTRKVERLVRDYVSEHGAAALWVSHDPLQRQRVGGRSLVMEAGRLREEMA